MPQGLIPEDSPRIRKFYFDQSDAKEVEQRTVLERTGSINVVFVWVSPDRRRWKFVNSPHPPMNTHKTWHQPRILEEMGSDSHFAVLVKTKSTPNGKSNTSFDVLGILYTFETAAEAGSISKFHQKLTEDLPDFEKIQTGFRFACEVLGVAGEENGRINLNTLEMYGMFKIGKGDLVLEAITK